MKIGFLHIINTNDDNRHYPLSFAYLMGYLNKHIPKSIDTVWLEQQSIEQSVNAIDILCVSCISQDFGDLEKTISAFRAKNPGVAVIFGGNHITNFPQTLPKSVDIGVIGEGEITFYELITSWMKKNTFLEEDLEHIDGIVYRTASGILNQNKPRQLHNNLDDFGLPDRSIFPNSSRSLYLLTSRGCPYECAFCSTALFWKKTRSFSTEYIADDIETILAIAPDTCVIGVWDDLFISNKKFLLSLRNILKQRKLLPTLKLHPNVRANLISEAMCTMLHQLNVCGVSFGFESACDKNLRIVKPATSVDINLKALDTLKKFNIPACCSFILGIPGETEAEAKVTLNTIINLISDGRLNEPHLNILMPMPNTIFWNQAEKQGLLSSDKNMEWNRLRYYASYLDSVFNTPEEWAQARLKNRSIYLNEEYLKEETLLGLIVDYEKKIQKIRQNILSKSRVPYHYFAPVDPAIPNNAHSFILHNIDNNSVVLECGSSGGHFTKGLAQKNCTVDCIENDKTVADMAYQFAQNIFIENLDDETFLTSLSSKKYDYVVLADVLEHLNDPDTCLMHLKNTLKDTGKIIVSLPNIAHGSIRLKLLKGNFQYEESGLLDKTHLHFYEFNSIIELFNRIGLYIDQIDMVRVPVEHELSKVNLDDFDTGIINEINRDPTSFVWQYVIAGTKMNGSQTQNNADELYAKIFGHKPDLFAKKESITADNKKRKITIAKVMRKIRRCLQGTK